MKKQICSLTVLVGLFFLSGCFNSAKDEKKAGGLYLINVLDKTLFDDCHIPGSINLSIENYKKVAKDWPKDSKIVVYCSNYMCEASGHCSKNLKKMGFDAVYDYDEGMAGWYQAHLSDPEEYPVNGPCEQKYLTMENKQPVPHDDSSKDFSVITTQELKELIDEQKQEDK
jgi:rhodanese-related sulfurtransferase